MQILPQSFYQAPTIEVAQRLLGAILVSRTPQGVTSGIIVETEAYLGARDKASHAYGNRRTPRTVQLFVSGGRAYVYLIYGLYHCLNVTTGDSAAAECVLIRALEPLDGFELMEERRNTNKLQNLTSGPGRLCQALSIDRSFNGEPLNGSRLLMAQGRGVEEGEIVITPRIGIDYAEDARLWPLRFYLRENRHVSRTKR